MRHLVINASLAWLALAATAPAVAQDQEQEEDDAEVVAAPPAGRDSPEQAKTLAELKTASAPTVRRFHEVLDELLAEFGYDVKMGQIKGLSNLAIRQIKVSKAIPRTYEEYAEMLLAERIRENSQIKLIQCVPCKTRTSTLVEGKLMISSPATNMAKLESAAATLGIENFMDAVLVYHTTHMVLAVSVFNVQTKELTWARTYNSETVKSRYQKLAVDYSQVATARPGDEYVPEYRFLVGLGGAAIPNVAGDKEDSTMMNLQIRATEKFNNRRTEFGMMLSALKTTGSVVKDYPADKPTTDTPGPSIPDEEEVVTKPTPKPFETAFAIYAMFGHVFVGAVESYNQARHGLQLGVGALASAGYVAPAVRAGWDVFLGRRFGVSVAGNYIAPSTILVEGESIKTKGGAGADVVVSFNY